MLGRPNLSAPTVLTYTTGVKFGRQSQIALCRGSWVGFLVEASSRPRRKIEGGRMPGSPLKWAVGRVAPQAKSPKPSNTFAKREGEEGARGRQGANVHPSRSPLTSSRTKAREPGEAFSCCFIYWFLSGKLIIDSARWPLRPAGGAALTQESRAGSRTP